MSENQNRRSSTRSRTLKKGEVAFNNRFSTMAVKVRNESETGALLIVDQNHAIPSEFELTIYPGKKYRPAAVAWRTPEAIGVKFLDVLEAVAPQPTGYPGAVMEVPGQYPAPQPVAQQPVVQQPIAQQPTAPQPIAQQPMDQPMAEQPALKQAAQPPVDKTSPYYYETSDQPDYHYPDMNEPVRQQVSQPTPNVTPMAPAQRSSSPRFTPEQKTDDPSSKEPGPASNPTTPTISSLKQMLSSAMDEDTGHRRNASQPTGAVQRLRAQINGETENDDARRLEPTMRWFGS